MGAGEALVLLMIVALVAGQVVAPLALYGRGKRIAAKRGGGVRKLVAVLPVVSVATSCMGFAVSAGLLIDGFAEVAGADSANKATTLAKNISEAMNCGAFFSLLALSVCVLGAAALAITDRRR